MHNEDDMLMLSGVQAFTFRCPSQRSRKTRVKFAIVYKFN